jgi:hypothetical protein
MTEKHGKNAEVVPIWYSFDSVSAQEVAACCAIFASMDSPVSLRHLDVQHGFPDIV